MPVANDTFCHFVFFSVSLARYMTVVSLSLILCVIHVQDEEGTRVAWMIASGELIADGENPQDRCSIM